MTRFTALARAGFALLFVVVTYLTVTPNPDDTEGGMAWMRMIAALLFGDGGLGDKVAHFLAYAALGAAAVAARLRLFGASPPVAAALALYGAALEGVQGLMGARAAELADAAANAGGALAGVLGASLALSLAQRFLGGARA